MKKASIICLLVIVALSVLTYAEEDSGMINPEGLDGKVSLEKGWNLVSIYALSGLDIFDVRGNEAQLKKIEEKNIRAIFFYDKYNKKYIQLYPPNNAKEKEVEAALQYFGDGSEKTRKEYAAFTNSPFWVFSAEKQTVNFHTVDGPFILNYIALKRGWNFLIVTPEMVGKKVVDVAGNCIIENSQGWEPDRQRWNDIRDENLPKESVFSGIVLKVKDDCTLGNSGTIGVPPEIPN